MTVEILAKRLKWLRENNRYSQKEVGNIVGMTASGYQKLEYDERDPKLDVLVELAKLYKVTTDFLLGATDETDKLRKYVLEARTLFTERSKLEKREQDIKSKLNYLTEEIESLQIANLQYQKALENEFRSEEEFDDIKKRVSMIRERISIMQDRVYECQKDVEDLNRSGFEVSKEYSYVVLKYIQLILDIPYSKASNSSFLQKHMPITTGIQETLFETYSIIVSGKYFTSYMGDYQTIEALEEDKQKLDKFLNS